MHPREDNAALNDHNTHPFGLDIIPEASWFAGLDSSQDIDATATLASFSDEDVENLKFFTHYCSSFLGYLGDFGESLKESERTSSSPDSPIPIATPVPLPYSARSCEVLESMISGPKGAYSSHNETLAHSLTLAEKLERDHVQLLDSVFQVQDEEMLTKRDYVRSAAGPQPMPSKAVLRPIRPVSPSTLIALTEPCLMAWSTCLPLTPLPAQDLRPTIHPTLQGTWNVPSPSMYSGRNSWGY